MLERFYSLPQTRKRIAECWLGPAIGRYVDRLTNAGYSASIIYIRVPLLFGFSEYATRHGASDFAQLPSLVEPYVRFRARHRDCTRCRQPIGEYRWDIRQPIQQMLQWEIPGYVGLHRRMVRRFPFSKEAPGFPEYLRSERGVRPATERNYLRHLTYLADFLRHRRVGLRKLTPRHVSEFVAEMSRRLCANSMGVVAASLRVFFRFLHRERVLVSDLSETVEPPVDYLYRTLPRSISAEQVKAVLAAVDRSTPMGKRDYAMLLLFTTYGLRSREVAALTLADIDWSTSRIAIPERKAGHSSAYPLSIEVGNAVVDYLRSARPPSPDRRIFLRTNAPARAIDTAGIARRVQIYLKSAGIRVYRGGSYTLRHACVQRLVEANFSLKTIGDYLGHGAAESTQIYAKLDVESLRSVALGDGEELL